MENPVRHLFGKYIIEVGNKFSIKQQRNKLGLLWVSKIYQTVSGCQVKMVSLSYEYFINIQHALNAYLNLTDSKYQAPYISNCII